MSTYPTGGQYRESLQNPTSAFKDPLLRGGQVRLDPLGMPKAISGAFASVFTVTAADNRKWAVKCFTRNVGDQGLRYRAISDALRAVTYSWKVEFQYEDPGVLVNGVWYPVLRMEWVEAQSLISYIEANLWNPNALAKVAANFGRVVADLERSKFAHGDLQHGNILVAADGSLRLIDYDGMYVPSLQSSGATEKGHVNYQSPLRRGPEWGPHLDRFSAWVIYTSLTLLTLDPTLWPRLHQDGDEALLLRADDFSVPQHSALLAALGGGDPGLTAAATALGRVLNAKTLDDVPPLDVTALPEPVSSNAYSSSAVAAAHTSPPGTPPWLQQAMSRPATVLPAVPSQSAGGSSWIEQHLPPPPQHQPGPVGASRRLLAWALIAACFLVLLAPLIPILAAASTLLGIVFLSALVVSYLSSEDRAVRRQRRQALDDLKDERKAVAQTIKDQQKAAARVETTVQRALDDAQKKVKAAVDGEQREIKDSDRTLQQLVASIGARRQTTMSNQTTEIGNALRLLQQQHVAQHLARYTIKAAGLPGVGPSLCQTLESYGIRTAADFSSVQTGQETYVRLPNGRGLKVPGLGPKKGWVLQNWRSNVYATAVSKQPQTLPPPAEQAIRAKYASLLQGLVSEERAAQAAAAQRRTAIQSKWQATNAQAARELAEKQRVASAERAAVAAKLAQLNRRMGDVDWRMSRALRELEATRNLRLRHYLRASLGA